MEENRSIETKIAIVGSGPAGLMASLWLIKNKTPHLLIDSNSFPRHKACGDIVTSKAIRSLNEIDEEIIPDMINKGLLAPIWGNKMYVSNPEYIEFKYRGLDGNSDVPSCYSGKRAEFDDYLLNRVKKSEWVKILPECYIKSIKSISDEFYLFTATEKIIKTKIIIGAWGSNSNLSKQLGALFINDRHFAIGIQAYFKGLKCKADVPELILDKSVFPGGFYITPLTDTVCNVNLVVRKDILAKRKIDLKKHFDYLCKHNQIIIEKFKDAHQISEFKGSVLSLGTKKRKITGKGYMLAGDAAGLIDLITGNGIPQAMISGKFAAQKAIECLEKNDFSAAFMNSYEKKLYYKIRNDVSVGKLINPIFSNQVFKSLLFASLKFLSSKNSTNSALVNLLYNRNPVYTLFNPVFYYKLFFSSKTAKNKNHV
jgi:flavin-dependent dehydrogenase